MPEAIVTVASVQAHRTRSGSTRFVLTDEQGREYTTFKEPIARQALAAEGGRARISFHETQRGSYTNVYVDAVEPLPDEAAIDDDRAVVPMRWRGGRQRPQPRSRPMPYAQQPSPL